MKNWFWIIVIVGLATGIICYFIKTNPSVNINKTIVDSIKVQNDSISTVIKESTERAKVIKINYEEKVKSVDVLPIDSNCIIFSNFVSKDSL